MEGILVETTLKPYEKGHMRTHIIHADFPCIAVEGGFSLPYHEPAEVESDCMEKFSEVKSGMGTSKIVLKKEKARGEIVFCEANVNLMHPRTVLPYIRYEISKGMTEICVYVEGIPAQKQ